jgi:sodium-dependent phosphate cotransporter
MCVTIIFPLEISFGLLEKAARRIAVLFADCGGIECTSPIKLATKPAINAIENFLFNAVGLPHKPANTLLLVISFLMLFFSLFFIVKLMKSMIMRKTEAILDNVIGKNALLAILGGFMFTTVVQSSSITTALLVPLVGAGIISVESAFPVTMGANIGTTTTAILASFATGNISAITIAFVHFLFNFIGVSLIYPISYLRKIPINLAKRLGDLAYRKRRYALMYSASIFFIIPGLLILISKLLK